MVSVLLKSLHTTTIRHWLCQKSLSPRTSSVNCVYPLRDKEEELSVCSVLIIEPIQWEDGQLLATFYLSWDLILNNPIFFGNYTH